VLLIAGMVKVFVWTGRDLGKMQKAHQGGLRSSLDPVFFVPSNMNIAVSSNIFGEN